MFQSLPWHKWKYEIKMDPNEIDFEGSAGS